MEGSFSYSPTDMGSLDISVGKFTFSPLSPMATEDQVKPGSVTPRRKLSMNMDENAQSSFPNSSDIGYGDSGDSCSSFNFDESLGSIRSPLSEITPSDVNVMCPRRTLLAKRSFQTKDISHRPSSLPSLASPPGIARKGKERTRNFMRQISSPLERMHLVSPGHSRPSSTTSGLSESDGYFSEVFSTEEMEEAPVLSNTLSRLINGPLNDPTPMTKTVSDKRDMICPTPVRPNPCHQDVSTDSVKEPEERKKATLKRSSPQNDINKLHQKKKRPPLPFSSSSQDSPPKSDKPVHGVALLRSQSLSVPLVESNTTLLSPGSGDEKFIGDFSKTFALPLVEGGAECRDLKCISPQTVCDLLKGNYSDVVDHFTIIDCRFPYEYEGGHIKGAKNIWMQDEFLNFCFNGSLQHPQEGHREIFVFHCEFSSKRGPKMSRFLRNTDRTKNGTSFPKLYYPELYLLDGGYRSFFQFHPEMCEPRSYRCMVDKNHVDELRSCKLRSKSWNGECQSRRRPLPNRRHRHSIANNSKSSGLI